MRARNRPGARQCAGSCRTWLRLYLFLGFTTAHPLAFALLFQHGGFEHPAVMPPERGNRRIRKKSYAKLTVFS
ncbi:hypothetical protein C5O84_26215 [Escherichia coli]|nr:hypothetical protein C5O84_26215 [Escherichia coli]PPW37087.1 hypothetical protein C5O99_25655 [Escherichia coli]HBX8745449.1 hypothetical protein [Klebsiella pneumoniae]